MIDWLKYKKGRNMIPLNIEKEKLQNLFKGDFYVKI